MKKTLLATAIILGALVSCTKDFEKINTNPNQISMGQIQPSGVFEPLLLYGANGLMGRNAQYGAEIAQVTVDAGSNVRDEHRYVINSGSFGGIWNTYYEWAILADHMYDLAKAQDDPNYMAIGLTMKVYYMAGITDLFGGIAYEEGLRADEGIKQPKINTQKETYELMMADLERANSLYKVNAILSGKDKDAMYGGDLQKWQKFTNTLHLRLLMRVSGRNDSFSPKVSDRIAAIVNDPAKYPVFESNADNAYVHYSGANSYYTNTYNTLDYSTENSFTRYFSEQFVGMLVFDDGFVDPRMKVWGKPRQLNDFKWLGAVSGCSTNYVNADRTVLNKYSYTHYETLCRDTAPHSLMSYDELLFIKAEAALNGWISGSAEDLYKAAIAASCEKWNEWGAYAAYPVSATETTAIQMGAEDVDAIIAHNPYNGFQSIAEQKWIALFWTPSFDMYNEMRRTGYPEVKIGKGAIAYNYTGGEFVGRMCYPDIAKANNGASYLRAIQEMGGSSLDDDSMTLPVWWSYQAVSNAPHAFRNLAVREE